MQDDDAPEPAAADLGERPVDRRAGVTAVLPAWRRRTVGEQRWNGAVAVLCMIVLQLFLPERLSLGGRWLLPVIELIIIGVLIAANPGRMERRSALLRMTGLVLISVASLGNAWRSCGSSWTSRPRGTSVAPPSSSPPAVTSG